MSIKTISVILLGTLALAACIPTATPSSPESSPIPTGTSAASATSLPTTTPEPPISTSTSLPPSPTVVPPTATSEAEPTSAGGNVQAGNALLWTSFGQDLFNSRLGQDPADPQRIAYCAPGEIKISMDGGQTWDSVPTTSLAAALSGSQYEVGYPQDPTQPQCLEVLLDPLHQDSFFAVFTTQLTQYGAPPVFYMGFVTTDRGSSWTWVPAPGPDEVQAFGGFWGDGQGKVQAMYMGSSSSPQSAPPVFVEESRDGGATWSAANMACPLTGPCVRWGAAAGQIPGMGSPLPQYVYASSDGGQTWASTTDPVELRLQGVDELAAMADGSVQLVAGLESSPLRISQDGGLTWQTQTLPNYAASSQPSNFPNSYPGLQLLPDGSYISQPVENSDWMLLPRGGTAWCDLSGVPLPATIVTLRYTADAAQWYDAASGSFGSVPLSSLVCP